MRLTLWNTTPALAVLALASQLWAGGFYLTLGSPEASPEARKLNAILTIKMDGCHDPGAATVTATAIGMVNGQRREIPLQLQSLATPGMYALAQQWPKEGRWVLKLVARNGQMFTNSLVTAVPNGIATKEARTDSREFTTADVAAMLK
jgi:hypothetical protein